MSSDFLPWVSSRYGVKCRGVLHVGANLAQEAQDYASQGFRVVWIEADPGIFPRLKLLVEAFPLQEAYLCAASDTDDGKAVMYIASNEGGSSSVLQPNVTFLRSLGVSFPKTIDVHLRRLDSFLPEEKVNLEGLDVLVLDVQGYELQVLHGLGRLIDQFHVVVAEVNWKPYYKGCTSPSALEDFLLSNGFWRAWLGFSSTQATGVYLRRHQRSHLRWVARLSIKLWELACRCGIGDLLGQIGLLRAGRQAYKRLKGR